MVTREECYIETSLQFDTKTPWFKTLATTLCDYPHLTINPTIFMSDVRDVFYTASLDVPRVLSHLTANASYTGAPIVFPQVRPWDSPLLYFSSFMSNVQKFCDCGEHRHWFDKYALRVATDFWENPTEGPLYEILELNSALEFKRAQDENDFVYLHEHIGKLLYDTPPHANRVLVLDTPEKIWESRMILPRLKHTYWVPVISITRQEAENVAGESFVNIIKPRTSRAETVRVQYQGGTRKIPLETIARFCPDLYTRIIARDTTPDKPNQGTVCRADNPMVYIDTYVL